MHFNSRKDAPEPGEVRGDRRLEVAVREGSGAGGGQGLDAPLQRVHHLRHGAVQRQVPLQDEVRLQSVNRVRGWKKGKFKVYRNNTGTAVSASIMLLRCSCQVSGVSLSDPDMYNNKAFNLWVNVAYISWFSAGLT